MALRGRARRRIASVRVALTRVGVPDLHREGLVRLRAVLNRGTDKRWRCVAQRRKEAHNVAGDRVGVPVAGDLSFVAQAPGTSSTQLPAVEGFVPRAKRGVRVSPLVTSRSSTVF